MDYILQTDNLSKIYGAKTVLNHVSIHVPKKSIYGLVGKNCKNRHPSPICTRFEHHLAGVLAPLSRTEATKPYNWFSTAKL